MPAEESDATALAGAIRAGRTTASAAMAAALAAAGARADLGALARIDAELGLAAARTADAAPGAGRGPFHGVPFVGKDLGGHARGLAPAGGCAALRRRGADPAADSDLFAAFRTAGLIPFGLSTVPPFGLALTSDPASNPWNPEFSPGGSSGGAAAAVAGGIVAIAHATDAAGSIRVPAAACGLWGLKPSRGRLPGGPLHANHLMGIAAEFALARSLRDIATLWQALANEADHLPDRRLRVGLALPDRAGPAQRAAAHACAEAIGRAGHEVCAIAAPDALGAIAARITRRVLTVALAEWFDAAGIAADEVPPIAAAIAAEGRAMPATALVAAAREMAILTDRTEAMLGGLDLILYPTLAGPPPRVGSFDMAATDTDAHFAAFETIAPNAALANATGQPVLSLPWGLDPEGLPVGLSLHGRRGAEALLLGLAAAIDRDRPGHAFPHPVAGLA
jgi:amidase